MMHNNGLSFRTLREANKVRLPQFKNRNGEPAHSEPDGSDWKLSAWSNAVCGELGEAANIIKKIERGDISLDTARGDLADELADVATYLDILAFRAGIDLGRAVQDKFNRVSERVGANVRIGDDDDWHQRWDTYAICGGSPAPAIAEQQVAEWVSEQTPAGGSRG